MIAHTLANGSSAMRTQGLVWKLVTSIASGVALAFSAPSYAATEPAKESAAKDVKGDTEDVLIFRNGTTLKGKIMGETPTTLKFKGTVSGIALETEYNKNELLEIKRGLAKSAADSTDKKEDAKLTPAKTDPKAGDLPEGATKYVYLELTGDFGEQISETPLRDAMKEAYKANPDLIIFMLDANWFAKERGEAKLDMELNDWGFGSIFRALPLLEVLGNEVPAAWGRTPRYVFWVKQAMGAAAFMPMISKEIYFHPEARMGGVGTLGDLFLGRGNERVVEKQKSLRLQAVVGWANRGGYPEELIRAMTMREYVLSVRFEGGKPVYFERMPEGPDELLLTDDGKEGNADNLRQIADGTGNDVLTLKADNAQKLGVSKGNVESKVELLTALGLSRTGVDVSGRGPKIFKDWADGLEGAKRQIRMLLEEYGDVRVRPPGGYAERSAARGSQKQKLESIKNLLKRWGEGIPQRWLGENRVPDLATIDNMIEQLNIDQMKDKK